MGELGDSAKALADSLSAGMGFVRSVLAGIPIFDESEEEPEKRLAEYIRRREWRRKMNMPDEEFPEVPGLADESLELDPRCSGPEAGGRII